MRQSDSEEVYEAEGKRARDGAQRGGRSGFTPDTYRCSAAADGKLSTSCRSLTQFYLDWFGQTNRYNLSRQHSAGRLSESQWPTEKPLLAGFYVASCQEPGLE